MAPHLETPIIYLRDHLATDSNYIETTPQIDLNIGLSYDTSLSNTPLIGLPAVLCSSRTLINGVFIPATLVIDPIAGKIIRIHNEILPRGTFPRGWTYNDYTPCVLMPGLVDAHVHLNEPGWRTEWEGFETGTRAAAFGGVTTLIDMPLNAIPPTTTVENLNLKVAAAQNQCWVDVGFYGGVIPGNEAELAPLVEAGVRGFKCFLIESGVSCPSFESPSTTLTPNRSRNFPAFPPMMSQKP